MTTTAERQPEPAAVSTHITAATIYNSLILGYIVFFMAKSNLLPQLQDGATLAQLQSTGQTLESERLLKILSIATMLGMLSEQAGVYQLTPLGLDLQRNRGFFSWAIGGYSPLLESMERFLETPGLDWRPFVRGNYVAIGSDEANQGLMQDIFDRAIDDLPATRIADLGCGNAGRLVTLLGRRPELTGVGIDIDPGAIKVAAANRDSHQLTSRLQLVQENVFDSLSAARPELQDVELVMSFMMLHDLFNMPELTGGVLFERLRAAFPQAKYFVFADTCLDEQSYDFDSMPVFTAGYELIHTLRGIRNRPLSYYEEQFAQGGFKLIARHDFGVPNTYLFILQP